MKEAGKGTHTHTLFVYIAQCHLPELGVSCLKKLSVFSPVQSVTPSTWFVLRGAEELARKKGKKQGNGNAVQAGTRTANQYVRIT